MFASKLSIKPDTMKQAQTLSVADKRRLREAAVTALIRRKPAGARIKLRDFKAVTNITTDSIMDSALRTMMRNGVISRYELAAPHTYAYTIPSDAKTITPPVATPVATPVTPVAPPSVSIEALDTEQRAMEYAWNASDDSRNDLRAFIEWLKKEK